MYCFFRRSDEIILHHLIGIAISHGAHRTFMKNIIITGYQNHCVRLIVLFDASLSKPFSFLCIHIWFAIWISIVNIVSRWEIHLSHHTLTFRPHSPWMLGPSLVTWYVKHSVGVLLPSLQTTSTLNRLQKPWKFVHLSRESPISLFALRQVFRVSPVTANKNPSGNAVSPRCSNAFRWEFVEKRIFDFIIFRVRYSRMAIPPFSCILADVASYETLREWVEGIYFLLSSMIFAPSIIGRVLQVDQLKEPSLWTVICLFCARRVGSPRSRSMKLGRGFQLWNNMISKLTVEGA